MTIKSICVLLLGLIGIFSVDPINFGCNSSQEDHNAKSFQLEEKEGRKIQKHFDLLHCNRLTSSNRFKVNKTSPPKCSSSRSPLSNKHREHTDNLATKYRDKMVEKTNERFMSNHIDVVIPKSGVLTH